ncbi:MAG: (2Fe-2S) ferredoxin domain-containing protein [Roseiflexaceae bacterium]|nr:(2Fe-2S) ferredoxin domain-containing protein [Roseiflexaceae bacterium]
MDEKPYRVYVCGNLHCQANGKDHILRALEDAIWQFGLDAKVEVRVSGCQNQCDFAPNLKIWPGPHQYSQLTPEKVRRIAAEHLRDDQPVAELLQRLQD